MKKILLAAVLTGAAAAFLIMYLGRSYNEDKEINDIEDAAEDAYDTMNKHIGKVERATEKALGTD